MIRTTRRFTSKSNTKYRGVLLSQLNNVRSFSLTRQNASRLESSLETITDSRFGNLTANNEGKQGEGRKLSREEVMNLVKQNQRDETPLSKPLNDQFVEKTFRDDKIGTTMITNRVFAEMKDTTNAQSTEEMKITTLDNGMRVITLAENQQVSGIGLYINSGTRYETLPTETSKGTLGATAMLERLAFKSSENYTSTSQVLDALQRMGANTYLTASREYFIYGGEVLSDQLEPFVDILSDSVFRPRFLEEDIEEQKEGLKLGLEEMNMNPESKIMDAMHYAAFGNSPLGRPLIPEDPALIDQIDSNSLLTFRRNSFAPQSTILIATGVEHNRLLKFADKYMSTFPGTKAAFDSKPDGKGLEYRLEFLEQPQHFLSQNLESLTHMVICFEGFSSKDPDYFALHVLRSLLGGGSSFSAGGPGKGVLTRLYTRGLNRHFWLQRVESSFLPLFDTGIFSMYGAAHHANASRLAPTMVSLLVTMAHDISDEELLRAKNQLKSRVLMALESRQGLLDEMAIGQMAYDTTYSAADLCQFIDNVTREDLARIADRIVNTKPGYVVIGDEKNTPSKDEVETMLKEMPKTFEAKRKSRMGMFNLWQ